MQISDNNSTSDPNIIVDFEESFKNCLSLLLINSETSTHDNPEDKKTGIEFAIESFVEKAKEAESFFITQRLIHSTTNTDDLFLEEINNMQIQLARKDELIKKHQDKLVHWQSVLADFAGPTSLNQQPAPVSSSGFSMPRHGSNLSAQGTPQFPPGANRLAPGNSTLSGLLSRTALMPPLTNNQHGIYPLQPPHQVSPSKLEGPLAFLEKTASNIGHN